MQKINYDQIPCKEWKSTGETVVKNSFYIPKKRKKKDEHNYETMDLFGLNIDKKGDD